MRSSRSLAVALILSPLRALSAVAASVTDMVSARLGWQPLDHHVLVSIDDSDDPDLKSVDVHGVIRAWQPDTAQMLLVELHRALAYRGKFDDDIRWLVATPCHKWHGSAVLPLAWVAVRLIAAPSFADAHRNRTVGTGRLRLRFSGHAAEFGSFAAAVDYLKKHM